jgi:hypothetical protein
MILLIDIARQLEGVTTKKKQSNLDVGTSRAASSNDKGIPTNEIQLENRTKNSDAIRTDTIHIVSVGVTKKNLSILIVN